MRRLSARRCARGTTALRDGATQHGNGNQVRAARCFPARTSGLLYAYLGRKDDALREGNTAAELLPIAKDGYDGTCVAAVVALIHARSGETDQAIQSVERLLRTPGPVMPFFEASITLPELRTRWQWAPLRNDPRFVEILARPERATVTR